MKTFEKFLKIVGVIGVVELAAIAVNAATGSNAGSWLSGGFYVWALTSLAW